MNLMKLLSFLCFEPIFLPGTSAGCGVWMLQVGKTGPSTGIHQQSTGWGWITSVPRAGTGHCSTLKRGPSDSPGSVDFHEVHFMEIERGPFFAKWAQNRSDSPVKQPVRIKCPAVAGFTNFPRSFPVSSTVLCHVESSRMRHMSRERPFRGQFWAVFPANLRALRFRRGTTSVWVLILCKIEWFCRFSRLRNRALCLGHCGKICVKKAKCSVLPQCSKSPDGPVIHLHPSG